MAEKRIQVQFVQRINRVNVKTIGVGVGPFLAVAFPNQFDDTAVQIFNILTGKPLVPIRFASTPQGIEDAIKVARWLDDVYRDYLEIPTAKGFEDADIIDLTQWTVENGIRIRIAFELMEKLQNDGDRVNGIDHMTAALVGRAYNLAEPEVQKWTGFMRPR